MKTEALERQQIATETRRGQALAQNLNVTAKIRTILVPTDFSPPAEKALVYATALARQFGAKLVLMHAIKPIYSPDFYTPIADDSARAGAEARLKEISARLQDAGVLTRDPRVVEGVAWDSIVRTAESVKADLIVISTHGYTGLKHVFLGSTTERVVRHAPCPALVVREQERDFVSTTTSASQA